MVISYEIFVAVIACLLLMLLSIQIQLTSLLRETDEIKRRLNQSDANAGQPNSLE